MSPSEFIYLDHAAATPLDERVEQAMRPYFREQFFNPSSPYAPAVAVRRAYEDARHRLAVAIGASRDDIILTAGATESINLALSTARGGHVVTTTIEHPAVLRSAERYDHTLVAVEKTGYVQPESVKRAITPETQIVSIGLANNELGTVQPIRDIAEIVKNERQQRQKQGNIRPIWLHVDASQGVGLLDVNVGRLGVDMLTVNSAKLYGPKQVALLYRRAGITLEPIIYGGGQELGLRSGTENVAGAVGFAMALEIVCSHRKSETKRLSELRDTMQSRLTEEFGDAMLVFGHKKHRLANFLTVSWPGLDAERLIFMLEARGVLVASGSACAANKGTGSHVLRAIGASESEINGNLRLSLGALNNQANIEQALAHIIECVHLEFSRIVR